MKDWVCRVNKPEQERENEILAINRRQLSCSWDDFEHFVAATARAVAPHPKIPKEIAESFDRSADLLLHTGGKPGNRIAAGMRFYNISLSWKP